MSIKYGNDGSNPYNKEQSGQFNGRSDTPRDYWEGELEYTNVDTVKFADGTSVFHDITKGKETLEMTHPSGSSVRVLPDGSVDITVNNSTRFYHKGSKTDTIHGNMDSKVEGHVRTSVTGGIHSETKGDQTTFVGGTQVSYIDGASALWSKDKFSVSSQKGVGLSVTSDKDTISKAVLEPDGKITLWNPKSKVIIAPDGTITIESTKGVDIKSNEITLEAGTINIKGFINHSGSMTTSGVHTDSNGIHQ